MDFFKKVWREVRNQWASLPILGPLAYCSVKSHKSSLGEMTIIVIFSTMTFWLSAFLMKALKTNAEVAYVDILLSTVKSGELFIFAVAFMGPVLMIATEDPSGAKPFPGRTWHILLLMLIAVVCGGFFAAIKLGQETGIYELFNQGFLFSASLWLAGAAIFLRYLAILYRKNTFVPEKDFKRQEDDLTKEFESRHSGGGA